MANNQFATRYINRCTEAFRRYPMDAALVTEYGLPNVLQAGAGNQAAAGGQAAGGQAVAGNNATDDED